MTYGRVVHAFSYSNAAFQTAVTQPGNGELSEILQTGMNHFR